MEEKYSWEYIAFLQNKKAAISAGIYVLISVIILILILFFWIAQSEKTHQQVKQTTEVVKIQLRNEIIGKHPVASACKQWFSEGYGLPKAVHFYKIPEIAEYTGWGCCQELISIKNPENKDITNCLKACAAILSELDKCLDRYDLMKSPSGKPYTSPGSCYQSRFEQISKKICGESG